MIQVMLTALLALPFAAQDDDAKGPSPERVAEAIAELEAAFDKGEPDARIAAIGRNRSVLDKKVVDLVALGLRDKDRGVLLASVDALGWMDHPAAIDGLERYYTRNKKKLQADEELMPIVLKSIARHGRISSIKILTGDPQSVRTYAAVRARLLGLANIRSADSVNAIFDLAKRVGYRKLDRYMDDIRLALTQLTGEDRGPDFMVWEAWWRKARKGYKVNPLPPEMDEDRQRAWDRYWGIERKKESPEEGGR